MIGALIIVFREVIEAGLIVGIVLAATRGVPRRGRYIAAGVFGGLAGAGLVALFAGAISEAFVGRGQELLNAGVLILATLMLIWHNAWMARHAAELVVESRAVGNAVRAGERPLTALAIVAGVAVLREGSEVVLFLYGIVAAGTSVSALLLGGFLGVAGGVALAGLSYLGLMTLPARPMFKVTGVLITLLAAGLAAQAVVFLNAAGLATPLDTGAWDTSGVLAQDSIAGRVLHTLIGYADRPTKLQIVVYLATILVMILAARYAAAGRRTPITRSV